MPISITPPPPPESATRTSTHPLITLPEGTNSTLIPLPTEAIARTFQQGHDLVILLTDGHRITFADFFVLPDPALILRDPTTGDYMEILLGEQGTLIGQQPRSVSELAERFTTTELTEWQAAETTTATTPETSTATATQTTGSGTGWTTATRLGVLAGSAAVLTALSSAARGTKGERPEGAANQTETETDGSDGSESSGAGTETDTTETDTDTQGGETDTEGDEEDTDAGMPTDQGTDTDEGTDAETSEETPDTDTDTHNPPQPIDPATHGGTDGEDASTDSDDSDRPDSNGTEDSGESSTATAGTNTNTDNADQQDSDQDSTNTAPAPPVDPNAETEVDSGTDQDGSSTAPDNRGTDPDEGGDNAGHEDADSMAPPPPVDQNNTAGSEQNESDGSENEPLTNGVDSTDTDGENSVAGPGPANSPGSVIINGTETEDQVLTATLNDADGLPDGVDIRYQWQRNTGADSAFENIENATSKTYMLGDGDVGREVRVEVRYTDGNNTAETVTSDATNAVTNINDAPTGAVIIDGTVEEDQTLTANITALQDADGLPTVADAFTYQWQRNTGTNGGFENIENATSETYTLGDADVGREVRVMVSYIDDGGMDESLTSAATALVENVNDAPSGSVSIEGTVEEDQTLAANKDNLDDADGLGAFSYQWQRSDGSGSFENIGGETSETYTLGDADVGREVQVVVNYTDARGEDETVISDVTAAVGNVNDLPTGDVTITGTVREDETLTANIGTLDDADGLGALSYQWQRSNGNGGFGAIENATSQTYILDDADVGREVQVMVSYTDARGEDETVISDATAAVTNVNDAPNGEVTIDGQATENATLTANTDNLADADGLGALSYQWQRSNDSSFENIAGETGNTYTLGDTDVGQTLRVQVSYRDQRGADERLISDATLVVTNVNDEPTGSVSIDGTAEEDQILTANTGTLDDADGLGAFSYQWQRNTGANDAFENIAGATGNTYTLDDADVGHEVQVMVSYTDDGGMDESVTSTPTAVVENINDEPTGSVSIDGTVEEDQTLAANTDNLDDADGLGAFSYQWQRSDGSGSFENIGGETSETYTLGDADVGRRLQVQVNYTDARGEDETVISDATAAVGNVNDLPTGAITITGTLREDETLTANTGTLDDADGLGAFSYQWQRSTDSSFENIENATGETYTLGDDDVGREVRVQVSYTDGNNTSETLNSTPTAEVINANIAPTGGVRIDGTVRQGQELSADTTAIQDADGLPDNAEGYRYQWQRTQADGTFADIEGATEQTYTVAMADVGQRLQVVVGYTDNNGADESLTAATVSAAASNATDPVIEGDANIMDGDANTDFFIGGEGNQRLNGFGGDDLLQGGAGADILDGGDGDDAVIYSRDSMGIDIEINLETGTGKGGVAEGDVLISIERITGGSGNDRLTGNNKDNQIDGSSGNDIIYGGAGNDDLFGSFGDDTLDGGDGNDSLDGSFDDDTLDGGEGNDTLTGSNGNDLFRFEPFDGSDTITDFGMGDDRLVFEDGLFANLAAVQAAATQTDDGNLEIKLSDTETLTLEGVTLAALTAETVTTLDAEGNDTTTPPADANSASDAPAFALDDLAINEEIVALLADSEGIHWLAPVEPQAPPSADEDSFSADKTLALTDPLEPPPALALFDADLQGYAGL